MTDGPESDHSRFHRWLLVATAVAAGLVLLVVYLSQHEHFYVSQRETQTAITAYYLVHEDHGLLSYITPVMGYPWAIPMELPVQQLLDRFIKSHKHMFLVEDEFGQTAGIVTLEDAIETLLGREILDENDTVADMQALARARFRDRLRAGKKKEGPE